MHEFGGRGALVTGGAAGFGLATAERLAAGGASVAIVDRNEEVLETTRAKLESRSSKVHSGLADVSIADDAEVAVKLTEEALGPIDILVNSGVSRSSSPMLNTQTKS